MKNVPSPTPSEWENIFKQLQNLMVKSTEEKSPLTQEPLDNKELALFPGKILQENAKVILCPGLNDSPLSVNKQLVYSSALQIINVIGTVPENGLQKPIIMLLPSYSSSSPLESTNIEPLLWISCVVLPKNYQAPFGEFEKSQKKTDERIYYLNSSLNVQNKDILPSDFSLFYQILTKGCQKHIKIKNQPAIRVTPAIFPTAVFYNGSPTALIFYNNQENGQEKAGLISASADRTVIIWDVERHKKIHIFNKDHKDGWGIISSLALHSRNNQLVLGGKDGFVRLVDIENQQLVHTFEGHTDAIETVAFHPREEQIASAGKDGVIRIWDILQYRLVHTLEGHSNGITHISFDPRGGELVSCSADHTLRTWLLDKPSWIHYESHAHEVLTTAIHPQKSWVISAGRDKTFYLWDMKKQRLIHKITHHAKGPITCLAFDRASAWFIAGSADENVYLWDAEKLELLQTFQGHMGTVTSVAFHPKKALFFSGSADGKVRQWDREKGHLDSVLKIHAETIECIAVHPKGKWLAYGGADKNIGLWDIDKKAILHIFKGHYNAVLSLAVQSQGKWLASGSADHTIRLWALTNKELVHTLEGHTKAVTTVAFHSEEKWIASGSADKTVRIWHIETGECLLTIQGFTEEVTSVNWMQQAKGYLLTGSKDKALRYWEITKRNDHQLHAVLRWSSCQTVVVAAEALIAKAQGLNFATKALFKQRGAIEEEQKFDMVKSSKDHKQSSENIKPASPALSSNASLWNVPGLSLFTHSLTLSASRSSTPHRSVSPAASLNKNKI